MSPRATLHRWFKGFTVVEVLMASGIAVVLLGMAVQMSMNISDASELASVQTELRSEIQRAMDQMVRELRSTAPSRLTVQAGPSLVFSVPGDIDGDQSILDNLGNIEWPAGNSITYQLAAGQQLVRVQGATQRVLANNVPNVTFDNSTTNPALFTNEVRIRLTLQRTTQRQRQVTISGTAVVRLRNS